MIVSGVLMMIALTDLKTKKIPDAYVMYVLVLGALAVYIFPETTVLCKVIGTFVISIPLLALICIAPGSVGGGDIKLMAAGGFLLGVTGVLNAFVTSILLAGISVILLLGIKIVDRKSEIALGPFLCIGIIWSLLKM